MYQGSDQILAGSSKYLNVTAHRPKIMIRTVAPESGVAGPKRPTFASSTPMIYEFMQDVVSNCRPDNINASKTEQNLPLS